MKKFSGVDKAGARGNPGGGNCPLVLTRRSFHPKKIKIIKNRMMLLQSSFTKYVTKYEILFEMSPYQFSVTNKCVDPINLWFRFWMLPKNRLLTLRENEYDWTRFYLGHCTLLSLLRINSSCCNFLSLRFLLL